MSIYIEKLFVCCRCKIQQFTGIKNKPVPNPPMCGWCAALEILNDKTWKWQRSSHHNGVWKIAKGFVEKNTDADLLAQLAITQQQLAELKRRVGRKRMVA